jgi:hypothetical protein
MSRHLIGRFSAVFMTAALLFSSVATVSAAVWTDQADYSPGSVVTISGDNSNGAGYLPGETVRVDVGGPNGYASSCDAVADENGAWSCQVTLWNSDLAVGEYSYTATGLTSGVSESGTFTDATAFALNQPNSSGSPGFIWHRTGEVPGGFNLSVSGTFRCDTSGSPDCTDSTVDITVHATNSGAGVGTVLNVGGTDVQKLALALGTGGSNTAWSTTFEFRSAPAAGQFGIPPDNTYEVKAVFKPVGGDPDITRINEDSFGVDNAKPTSTIDTVVASSFPTADGSATDPGSAKTYSGFDNSDSPKPMHVELRTDPGNVLVVGSDDDLALNNLGPTKQSGDWAYDYADYSLTPLTEGAGYCFVAWANDHAGNVQDPVTTECFTVDTAPYVSSTSPADNATGVSPSTNISITFSEAVDATTGWFGISCGTSGAHTAVESGGPTTFTLDPDTDFTAGETCTVTVYAANVTDQDTADPPDNMASDYVFDFTVAEPSEPVTPTLTTEVRDAADDTAGTSFPLGTAVYDHLSTDPGDAEGTATFDLYAGSDCTDQLGAFVDSWGPTSLSAGTADSGDSDPLEAGAYYFLVSYDSSDPDQWNDNSTCEEFTIETEATTTVTEVHDSSHTDITGTPAASGTTVHDSATVGTQVGSIAITGTVTYSFWSNGDCDGTADSTETVAVGTESSAQTPTTGSYSYKAAYSGDPNYDGSESDCEPFGIAPPYALGALSDFHGWIGLKNSDDQGTQFDLRVQLYSGATLVASGTKRCITGVTRNPSFAKDAVVVWDSFDPYALTPGQTLSLKISTRIGTNANDTKCSGPGGSHNSAVGLRLYYDSTARQSRFDATIGSGSSTDWYLRSDGNACVNAESTGVNTRTLSTTAPSATAAKCKDSTTVNFAGGNLWKEIGTWFWTVP